MYRSRKNESRDFSRRYGMGGPAANEHGTPLPYVWSLAGPEGAHYHFFVPMGVAKPVRRALLEESLRVARKESDLVDWSWGPIPEGFQEDPVVTTHEQFHKIDPSYKSNSGEPYVAVQVEVTDDDGNEYVWERPISVEFQEREERVQVMKNVVNEMSLRPLRFLEVEVDGVPSVREMTLDLWTASTMNQFYRALNEKNQRRWFSGSWPSIYNMFFRLLERQGMAK